MARILNDAPPNTELTPVELGPMLVSIRVKRPGTDPKPVVVSYSLLDALQAGALDDEQGREFYRKHPEDCLWAACVRRLAGRLFPHLTMGGITVADLAHGRNGSPPSPPSIEQELDQIEGR